MKYVQKRSYCFYALGLLLMISFLFSKAQAGVGVLNGQLMPCPNSPNCVCSEDSEDSASSAYIPPFLFAGSVETAWANLKQIVVSSGGTIHSDENFYLLASYTTKWLRFVDDVEFRMDAENKRIHVRSASRVGHSDFGANKKRVEMLRELFTQTSNQL